VLLQVYGDDEMDVKSFLLPENKPMSNNLAMPFFHDFIFLINIVSLHGEI
jgi:hypothetical protein